MLPAYLALASLSLLAPDTLGAATTSAASAAICDTYRLPPSIALESGLEPVVKWALTYSPTFRQQCRVLASFPRLKASVRVSFRKPIGGDRARAIVRRLPSGGFVADIEIRSAGEMTELLAHEFEHLIEQVDGVDLRTM